MEFLHRTPFVRLLLPLVAGIVLFEFFSKISPVVLAVVLAFACALILASLLFKKSPRFSARWIFGLGAGIFLLSLGYLLARNAADKADFTFSPEREIYFVEIDGSPQEKQNSLALRVTLLSMVDSAGNAVPARGNAMIYLQKDSAALALRYGDRLLVATQFAPPQKALNPDAFDYARYLRHHGIGAVAYAGEGTWQKTGKNESFSPFRLADDCRRHLLSVFRRLGLQGNEFAVVAALTLGYTDEISPDVFVGYSASGAVHILSVSGLHVGIVYGFLLWFLGLFLKNNRFAQTLKGVIIVVAMWAYAFLTGLSPCVMRAAWMFSFVALALCVARKSEIYNSVFASAFLILLIAPFNLFQIGFQLSYAAVLSIVYFSLPAHKILKTKNKIVVWAWNLTIVSIAAQIGTAPFALYYFHQFPLYFLLTNFIAIPLSSIIIYLAIITLALSSLPLVPYLLAQGLQWITLALNRSILTIYGLPHAALSVSADFWQMWLLVATVVAVAVFWQTKRFAALATALLCTFAVFAITLATKISTRQNDRMIVYAAQRNTHVSFISGLNNTVFTTDSADIIRLAKNFWDNNRLHPPVFAGENGRYADGFVNFAGKRIFIYTDSFFKGKIAPEPLVLDYLIIGAYQKPRIDELLALFQPRCVVVSSGVSAWYRTSIKNACAERTITCYDITENGAMTVEL